MKVDKAVSAARDSEGCGPWRTGSGYRRLIGRWPGFPAGTRPQEGALMNQRLIRGMANALPPSRHWLTDLWAGPHGTPIQPKDHCSRRGVQIEID